MNRKEEQIFFTLLRAGLAGSDCNLMGYGALGDSDWQKVYTLAEEQGLLGVVFSAIERLPKLQLPGMNLLMDWLGQVEYMNTLYGDHKKVIAELARFYEENGVKMMLLKGYGLSLNYPVPSRRPIGDIDIYNFGLWQFADQMVHDRLGIEVDDSHEHHTVFNYNGVMVENHYDFINSKAQKSNALIEARLKELANMGEAIKDAEIPNLYYPSPNLNALFIIRHCAAHFSSTEISLRQLLDWLLFVKRYHTEIDWGLLYQDLRRFNLDRFANSMNAIGVKYLGLDATLFMEIEKDDRLVSRILNDILSPEFTEKEDGTLLSGLWVKPRRWWHNRWKHKITSPDSLWSTFWYGVHGKLLRPSHFKH